MEKIKVGDKVRCLVAEHDWLTVGKIYKVVNFDTTYNTFKITTNYPYEFYWVNENQIEPIANTIDDLAVGDILVDGEVFRVVEAVCGNLVGFVFEYEVFWVHIAHLKIEGWKLKDSEDTVKVYTKQDIADKIKEDINNFRIEG